MNINGYDLVKTCTAFPEQYDVFKDGVEVGYLRLRHGIFKASYTKFGYTEVYTAKPRGDGVFEYFERESYLTKAIEAIDEYHKKEGC